MKRAILLVAFLLVLSSIPTTVARHRSVGAEDQVAVSKSAEPTVPSGGPGSPYQVGTTQPEHCYDPNGTISQAEADRARAADGFCSALVYNADGPASLEVVSAPDQHIPTNAGGQIGTNPIETFDVVRADLAGYPGGITLCQPFCKPGEFYGVPGGNTRHEIFYDTASQTGLFNDSDTTQENQRSNRDQYTSLQLGFPNAGRLVQEQTDLWEMNGWTSPSGEYTFVGFLEGAGGEPISDTRLRGIVGGGNLADGTRPTICGFTPDLDLDSTASDNFCEVELKYFEPDEREAEFTEYGDRCKSPTYVCHQAAGPAWRMSPPTFVFSESLGSAEHVETPFATLGSEDNKYREWHWVVAPHAQSCPVQEPGFSFAKGSHAAPYLAHDLDVYTPITRIDGASTSPGPLQDYANALVAGPADTVDNSSDVSPLVEETLDQILAVANPQLEAAQRLIAETQNQTVGNIDKPHRVEPNADPAKNPLADTSQSFDDPGLTRSLEDACERVISAESLDTVDPWVDLIDSELVDTRPTVGFSLGGDVSGPDTTTEALYGNGDPNQDDDNRPGPARLTTEGDVGLFTDKNDDGHYAGTGDPYRDSNILDTGAYPMLWNVKVETTDTGADITGEGSCQFSNAANTNLALEAQRMGYGPNTGLFQLVYLQEPAAVDADLFAFENRVVYSSGNNIYLLASQSVKTLWEGPQEIDPGAGGDFPIDNEVDEAIRALQSYADGKNGETLGEPDVKIPGEEFGLSTDFTNQCSGGTGAFESKISFTHDCQVLDCEGDTVLTQYVFEVTNPSGQFEDGNLIPSFSGLNEKTADFAFGPGVHAWTDVDPLDGDPDRNDDRRHRPPT